MKTKQLFTFVISLVMLTSLVATIQAQEELNRMVPPVIGPDPLPDYSCQAGSSLSTSGIGYGMLQKQEALKRLKEVESIILRQ